MSDLLTPQELSAYLNIPVPTLANWRSQGVGPASLRVGRHVRYRRTAVDRWLDAQERAGHPHREAK